MTGTDIDQLIAVLDPDCRGGRRSIDEVAEALRSLAPHAHAAALSELLIDMLRRGEAEGKWTSTRATVRRGRLTLPRSLVLARRAVSSEKLQSIGSPLRSELAPWAATLLLSATQRELVVAVNQWLRRTSGGRVPIAAAAERAYELLGDEKAFDSHPPRGGATLWRPDRLTFSLLRCERVATPLTWEPTMTALGCDGPVVCVENHATFRTMLRVLRDQRAPSWTAVAWVQGRNTNPLLSLQDLPFSVTRLDYLGDLDPAGLEIAVSACAAANAAGVPAGPADQLWELLVSSPSRPGRPIEHEQAERLSTWLPETVSQRAVTLLVEGRCVPQEALRYDVLVPVLRPTSGLDTTSGRGKQGDHPTGAA